MRTRVLRRPLVFLRVCCSICVRCSILILLIKIVRCSIIRCSIPYFITFCSLSVSQWHAVGNTSRVPRSVTIRQTSTAVWLLWLLSQMEACSLLYAPCGRPPETTSAPSSVIIFHEHTRLIGFWRINP